MKKLVTVAAMVVLISVQAWTVNENVVMWERIYQETRSDEQRLSVMFNIMEFQDKDFSPVIQKALEDIAAKSLTKGTNTELRARVELAKLLVRELGNLKALESAETINAVYLETKDEFLKAEAAIALGKMRAVSYAEQLSRDLTDNNQPTDATQKRFREVWALGLVQALQLMRTPLGFEPVFLAGADGWYSAGSGVKEAARTATQTMVDDPSDSILSIIEKNPSVDIKVKALEAALQSKASGEKKNIVASRAFTIGFERVAKDLTAKLATKDLRMKAMEGLIRFADKNTAMVAQLKDFIETMDDKTDMTKDEILRAYVVLGVNATNEAAKLLADKFEMYNELQKNEATTPRDKEIMKQILASMLNAKNPLVRTVLTQAQFNERHDGAILREIKNVLAKLP